VLPLDVINECPEVDLGGDDSSATSPFSLSPSSPRLFSSTIECDPSREVGWDVVGGVSMDCSTSELASF
jgi:hypothetical protein